MTTNPNQLKMNMEAILAAYKAAKAEAEDQAFRVTMNEDNGINCPLTHSMWIDAMDIAENLREKLLVAASQEGAGYGNQDQIQADYAAGIAILLERGDL